MNSREERNWDLLRSVLSAESSGKSPRMFASRRTLFGIPSALDQELEKLAGANESGSSHEGDAAIALKASDGADAPEEELGVRETAKPAVESERGRKASGKAPARVSHPLSPVYDERSRVLILGTMPSPRSRETGFYYNHPQNRFWKVIAALFEAPLPQTNEDKEALVRSHGIALWDVLAECTIEGASDGTIAECIPNDISCVFAKAPIEAVFCTGAKATELYRKYCEPYTGRPCMRLSSTSPANAATSLDQLIAEYRQILPYLE